MIPKRILPIRPLGLCLVLGWPALAAAVPFPAADTAYFAGGSFWCLEPAFESLAGVDSVITGYAGGPGPKPDFESVSTGKTGYAQAVQVFYRPQRIAYARLLDAYWRNIDPMRADGQFSDPGPQYRTLIYYRNEAQKAAALASKLRLARSKRFPKPLVTEIAPAPAFYRAEPEHQDYSRKSPAHYQAYLKFSGRAAFFKKAWGPKSGK